MKDLNFMKDVKANEFKVTHTEAQPVYQQDVWQ